MFFLVDATTLTYVGAIDLDFVFRHELTSISECIREATYNLDDEIVREKLSRRVKIIETVKPGVSSHVVLSRVDLALLETASKAAGAIMVTDDSSLAFEARRRRVKVFSTPEFVEYLVKNGREEKARALEFLQNLVPVYHRKNKVILAINRIEKF